MKYLAVLAVFAVAGCVSKPIEEMDYKERQALADDILSRCIEAGAKPNSRDMAICIDAEVQSEDARRKNNVLRRQAAGAALANYGAAMQRNSQRGMYCTHSPGYGGVVNTNCY